MNIDDMIDSTLVVVATHGTQYIGDCVKSLGTRYPIMVVETRDYMDGALQEAYWRADYKNYLLIQDSMRALQEDYVEPFRGGVTAWVTFDMKFDNPEQEFHVKRRFSYDKLPAKGIFGPVMFVPREILKNVVKPRLPSNKNEAQANERAWAVAFDFAGVPVRSLYDFSPEKMAEGLGPFKKIFAARQ